MARNLSLFRKTSIQLQGQSFLHCSHFTDKPLSAPYSVKSSAAPEIRPPATRTMIATLLLSTTLHESFSSFESDRLKVQTSRFSFLNYYPETKAQQKDTHFYHFHIVINFTYDNECHCQCWINLNVYLVSPSDVPHMKMSVYSMFWMNDLEIHCMCLLQG